MNQHQVSRFLNGGGTPAAARGLLDGIFRDSPVVQLASCGQVQFSPSVVAKSAWPTAFTSFCKVKRATPLELVECRPCRRPNSSSKPSGGAGSDDGGSPARCGCISAQIWVYSDSNGALKHSRCQCSVWLVSCHSISLVLSLYTGSKTIQVQIKRNNDVKRGEPLLSALSGGVFL